MVGQEGPTGFMGSSSQSSPASFLPLTLMTKLSSENTLSCPTQTRQVEAGTQKIRIYGEAGQGGRRKAS